MSDINNSDPTDRDPFGNDSILVSQVPLDASAGHRLIPEVDLNPFFGDGVTYRLNPDSRANGSGFEMTRQGLLQAHQAIELNKYYTTLGEYGAEVTAATEELQIASVKTTQALGQTGRLQSDINSEFSNDVSTGVTDIGTQTSGVNFDIAAEANQERTLDNFRAIEERAEQNQGESVTNTVEALQDSSFLAENGLLDILVTNVAKDDQLGREVVNRIQDRMLVGERPSKAFLNTYHDPQHPENKQTIDRLLAVDPDQEYEPSVDWLGRQLPDIPEPPPLPQLPMLAGEDGEAELQRLIEENKNRAGEGPPTIDVSPESVEKLHDVDTPDSPGQLNHREFTETTEAAVDPIDRLRKAEQLVDLAAAATLGGGPAAGAAGQALNILSKNFPGYGSIWNAWASTGSSLATAELNTGGVGLAKLTHFNAVESASVSLEGQRANIETAISEADLNAGSSTERARTSAKVTVKNAAGASALSQRATKILQEHISHVAEVQRGYEGDVNQASLETSDALAAQPNLEVVAKRNVQAFVFAAEKTLPAEVVEEMQVLLRSSMPHLTLDSQRLALLLDWHPGGPEAAKAMLRSHRNGEL
jgi:hypothetical protein